MPSFTDGLFTSSPPPIAKMQFLARVAGAIYDGSLATAIMPDGKNLRKLSSVDPPGVYAFDIGEQTVVVIPGTTSVGELASQEQGWEEPLLIFTGGEVNAFHGTLANQIFPALPNNTALLVGHSMGGSLACLLAGLLRRAGLPVVGAVGFASPRSLTEDAANASVWQPWINVVNEFDPIPLLVPDGFKGRIWRMPATQWTVAGDGTLTSTPLAPSTPMQIAALFSALGDQWHWIATYVNLLKAGTLPVSVSLPFGAITMAQTLYRFRVFGDLLGQQCNNIFWYWASSPFGGRVVCTELSALWRQKIIPRVSQQYHVVRYVAEQFDAVVPKDASVTPITPVFRFQDSIAIDGGASDIGLKSGDAMPSYVSVKMDKICSSWYDASGLEIQAKQKKTHGRIAIGGIVEGDTDTGANSNKLTEAALAQWQAAAYGLNYVAAGTTFRYWMAVVSEYNVGKPIFNTATPPQPTIYVAYVNTLNVSEKIRTQNSRRESVSGA